MSIPAIVRTALVEREIRAMRARSSQVRHQTDRAFATAESNPATFPEVDDVEGLLADRKDIVLRKVKIRHQSHDFRMLFLHHRRSEVPDLVDFVYVFDREDGYEIDWEWIDSMLPEEEEGESS